MRIHFKWIKDLNLFLLSNGSLREKTPKNAYNFLIEFLNKMKNVKTIKKKKGLVSVTILKLDLCKATPQN